MAGRAKLPPPRHQVETRSNAVPQLTPGPQLSAGDGRQLRGLAARWRRLGARLVYQLGSLAVAAVCTAPLAAQPGQGQTPVPPAVRIDERGDVVVSISERDGLPIKEFIKQAELITGRSFIYNENELNQAGDPNANKITFIGTKKMPKGEFFAFFQTLLYIKSLACVVRGKGATEIIEIISLNGPKRVEASSGATYVPPEKLNDYAAQTGVNIMTAVPVEHLRATQASQTLRPFFATTGAAQLNLGTAGNETVILVQGFAPQVVNAYELIKLVDQPGRVPDQEVKVVPLEHQSAEELVGILEQILTGPGAARGPAEGVAGGAIPGQGGQMKILPHTALNALILSGTREQVLEGMSIIAKLDGPVEQTQQDAHVVQVRNVQAKDLQETLRQFLQDDQTAQQAAQAGAAAASGGRRQRRTVVFAHEASNSLIVSGTATAVDSVKRVIEKLDMRQHQVLIEAAIVELTTSDAVRFGIELGALDIASNDYTRPFGLTSFGLSTFQDTDDNGIPDSRLPDFENPARGLTGGIIADDDFAIPVLLNALDGNSSANVLSLPSVVVNNNENAKVNSLEQRPTSNVSQNATGSQSGFQGFQDAGIDLSISPSISSNNYLRLNISLSVSRYLGAFDPSASTPGPKVTRLIQTQVTMPSGATMVLGGVIEDAESDTDDGVPFLKDIPILGWLFRSYSNQKTKTNLYFFLTPNILDETDFSDMSEVSFRKKMEAAKYIGHRRMQMVDRKWREPTMAQRLEDSGATVDDLDQYGGFEIPSYKRGADAATKQPPLPPRERDAILGPKR